MRKQEKTSNVPDKTFQVWCYIVYAPRNVSLVYVLYLIGVYTLTDARDVHSNASGCSFVGREES